MADEKGKAVTVVTVEPFKMDGRHYAVGEVLEDLEAGLALELAGGGKVRLADAAEIKAAKAKAKA